jgi:RNA polymerase sigma-70 factor (ECF subfamily)
MPADPLSDTEAVLRRVYAYVAYRIHDESDAEDITSETFERALRYRDRYDSSKGEPIGWLLGIARNCIYNARLRPRAEVSGEPEESNPGIDAEVVGRLTLRQALGRLSSEDQELLALRYGADLEIREMAKLLDRRANTIEVALSRARARLAQALDSDAADSEPRVEDSAAGHTL